MKLKNTSDKFSNELIRKVIDFVKPSGITNFDVIIKKREYGYSGLAHVDFHDKDYGQGGTVVLKFGVMKYPLRRKAKGGYIAIDLFSEVEVLVYVMAHELRHLWQSKVKKGWRYWGSKGQYSERDASCYGLHMVREWRRGNNV